MYLKRILKAACALLCGVMLVSFAAAASAAEIRGIVTFYENTPVRGAILELRGPMTVRLITDKEGEFNSSVPDGSYTLSVILEGKEVHSEAVVVSADMDPLSIQLGDNVPVQLLMNPGFEDVAADGTPIGWTNTIRSGDYSFAVETDRPFGGNYALRLEGRGSQPRVAMTQNPRFYDHYVDYAIRLSGWYRSTGVPEPSDAVGLRLIFKKGADDLVVTDDPAFQILSSTVEPWINWGKHIWLIGKPNVDEWQYLEIVLTPPRDADHINIAAFLERSPGIVWWDDIRIELIPR